jgi:hypothetical protein
MAKMPKLLTIYKISDPERPPLILKVSQSTRHKKRLIILTDVNGVGNPPPPMNGVVVWRCGNGRCSTAQICAIIWKSTNLQGLIFFMAVIRLHFPKKQDGETA